MHMKRASFAPLLPFKIGACSLPPCVTLAYRQALERLDIWMRQVGDLYKYVVIYVDELGIAS
jgi:hypothetical protein